MYSTFLTMVVTHFFLSLIILSNGLVNTGNTISTRFDPPAGFKRKLFSPGSFQDYLSNFPLKAHNSPILYYDGSVKPSNNHAAVLDIDVGKRDLQQCADAIMRLRAEYFYNKKEYSKISFHFVNGFEADYSTWASGKRIGIKGNSAYWYQHGNTDYSYQTFRKYLDMVFAYAGTASLEKELKPKSYKQLTVGDVFIHGGSPGHAMLVVDIATNEEGKRAFLLAQSYMPAQSIHIVVNPTNQTISPWYLLNEIDSTVETPSWLFYTGELYEF